MTPNSDVLFFFFARQINFSESLTKIKGPILFLECHSLVTLPDGTLQLSYKPDKTDDVKINGFGICIARC